MSILMEFFNSDIKTLEEIARGNLDDISTCVGICSNLCIIEVDNHVQGWKHYTGCVPYPVPVDGFEDSGEGYIFLRENRMLWVGEQLEYRKSLAEHILKHLRENCHKHLYSLK